MFVMCLSVSAQQGSRVAIFDPTSSGTSIDEGTKVAIREIISSTIVNIGDYNIVERSMLEKVMQEQSFSNSGVVDDSQATEIGKLAGANKVIVSVITMTGGRNMLSIKMIDVKTASVERQKVKVVTSGELLDIIEPMTLSLIEASDSGETSTTITEAAAASVDLSQELIPGKDEVVLYLPSGYEPKKEKERDFPLIAKLNKEIIGSGTLSTGFCIRIKNPGPGIHHLKFGMKKVKIDTERFNYFEFQIYRWNYLGKAIYGVSIKEQRLIK